MARRNGPWTIQETKEEYQDKFLALYVDQVLGPDGEPGTYSTVEMKAGVCILPVDEDGTVYLTRQFRYAIGRESLEVAAGGIDGEQQPLEAAQRELREEQGIVAKEWIELGRMDLDTSMVRCPIDLFVAKGLTFTQSEQESTEEIRTVRMSFADAVRQVMEGGITHSPSCVLILKAARVLGEGAS